jgi:hypothetical protein
MLCLLPVGRKKKKEGDRENKKETGRGLFPSGPNTPCWPCHTGFLQLLGAIKG